MFSPLAHHVTLKSFHLDCYSIHDVVDAKAANCLPFHNWIEEAKRRCLEELRLFYLPPIPLKPTTFFCSKTLVVLRL
ncbi:F-box/LRR-repeat protein, partial [Trifolium medium]|nr:F-box/LRR-repeat protein [Trifolium medium]